MLLSEEKDPPEDDPVDPDDESEEEPEDDPDEELDESDEEEDPKVLKEQNARLRADLNRQKAEAGQKLAALTAENKLWKEAQERLNAHGARPTTDGTEAEAAAAARAAFIDMQRSTDPRDKAMLLVAAELVKAQNTIADLSRKLDEVPTRASLKDDEREEVEAIAKERRMSIADARVYRKGLMAERAEKARIKRQQELERDGGETPRHVKKQVRTRSGRDVAIRESGTYRGTADQFSREFDKATPARQKEMSRLRVPVE